MPTFKVATYLLLAMPVHAAVFSGSEVVITGIFDNLPKGSAYDAVCHSKLDVAEVRKRFRTFHPITIRNLHDNYIFIDCGYEGTIKVGGKTYKWKSFVGNFMETTYPTGRSQLLGGIPDDDPSEGESHSARK